MPYTTKTADPHVIRPLSVAQARYAEAYANGKCQKDRRLHKLPQVQQAIANVQTSARSLANYELSKALMDCDRAIEFAYEKNNSMAVVKGLELKSKLAGLLVEKHEIAYLDFTGPFNDAKKRLEAAKSLCKLANTPPPVDITPESST